VLCTRPSNARAAFRGVQESAPGRLRPPSALHRRSRLVLASSSVSSLSPPRGVQLPRAVQGAFLPLTRSSRQPSLLAQLLRQDPRKPSRAFFGQTSHPRRFTPTHRAPRVGAQCWSRLTWPRDRVPAGGRRKKCWR
jgi:hypothetical protein